MDRLTTGRRHVRAGSVSVTELITRQAAPAPDATESTVTLDGPIEPEAGPTSHRRRPSRAAQAAKITSLAVATIALCGAIGVASTIAHQREAAGPTTRPAEIRGEQALLPGELDRTLAPTRATAADASRSTPGPTTPSAVVPPRTRAGTTASGTTASSDSPVTRTPVSDVDVVRQFYDIVPTDPTLAFDLLSPGLLNSTLGQFLESWSHVQSVDVVGIEKQTDGVLATVRLRLADGGQLRLQQVLTVAEGPGRIVGVRLLSALRN